jgi:alpha-2-macroglobulin
MRDERVEAFASLLWEGVHEYSFVATATSPGRFMVPPARAEEMYSPEVFGCSSYDKVIIE